MSTELLGGDALLPDNPNFSFGEVIETDVLSRIDDAIINPQTLDRNPDADTEIADGGLFERSSDADTLFDGLVEILEEEESISAIEVPEEETNDKAPAVPEGRFFWSK